MKKIIIILGLIIQDCKAQITLNYFPFNDIVSINSNPYTRVFIDYKVQTNSFFTNMNMEFSPKFNFKRKEKYNIYSGIGVQFNLTNLYLKTPLQNGYFVDFGCRLMPFEKIQRLNFIFEISPYINKDINGGNLRSRLGLSIKL